MKIPFFTSCMLLGAAAATLAGGADLSRYRGFQIGADLPTVARLAQMDPAQAKVIHQRPALIQELEWRPGLSGASADTEAVRVVVLSFYNGELFRIAVEYSRYRIEGLTADDLIDSISAVYGKPARPSAAVSASSSLPDGFGERDKVFALWQDSDYLLTLVGSSYDPAFGLTAISRRVDALAQTAMVEAARLDVIEAPRRERDRVAREAEDQRARAHKARLLNQPGFRP